MGGASAHSSIGSRRVNLGMTAAETDAMSLASQIASVVGWARPAGVKQVRSSGSEATSGLARSIRAELDRKYPPRVYRRDKGNWCELGASMTQHSGMGARPPLK